MARLSLLVPLLSVLVAMSGPLATAVEPNDLADCGRLLKARAFAGGVIGREYFLTLAEELETLPGSTPFVGQVVLRNSTFNLEAALAWLKELESHKLKVRQDQSFYESVQGQSIETYLVTGSVG